MRKLPILLVFLLSISRMAAQTAVPAPAAPRPLRVSLYPWIPDAANDGFKSLVAGLTSQFQAQHADIAVTITMTMADDPYQPSNFVRLFAPTGPNAVEVDTVTLGELLSSHYIAPLDSPDPVFTFADSATRLNGVRYAIPTWVCMTFFYGKSGHASQWPATPPAGTAGRLNGIWSGSWTLPSLYLGAPIRTFMVTYPSIRLC